MEYETQIQLNRIESKIDRIRQLIGDNIEEQQEEILNSIYGELEEEGEEETKKEKTTNTKETEEEGEEIKVRKKG